MVFPKIETAIASMAVRGLFVEVIKNSFRL
jgi:hypothetical protein